MHTLKNGELALKLRRLYTYESKVCFNCAYFEDQYRVRYFMGPPKVCFKSHMS